jgi:hypothetical protein
LKPVRKPEKLEVFDIDDEDEEFFYLAILEDLRKHRK